MADFEGCLSVLHQDREHASQLYLGLYRKLLTFFESNNCLDPNACADLVMDRFSEISNKERVSNPRSLIFSIAWHVRHEYWRNQKRENEGAKQLHRTLTDARTDRTVVADIDALKSTCRKRCLGRMAPEDLTLIKRYNVPGPQEKLHVTRAKLAEELGIGLPELRKHVFEIRRSLRDCYVDCVSARNHG